MLMEKLAKDVAELADAKIKTDLKYTPEKTHPNDDYYGARKSLLPNSTYINAPSEISRSSREGVAAAEAKYPQTNIQSPTQRIDDRKVNSITDYMHRISRDVVQPYLQKRYNAYADRMGRPRVRVKSNPMAVADDGSVNFSGDEAGQPSVAYFAPSRLPMFNGHIAHNTQYNSPDIEMALADAGIVGRGGANNADFLNDTIGHEMAHADPDNPYSIWAIQKGMPPAKMRGVIDTVGAIADTIHKHTGGKILPERWQGASILQQKKFNEMHINNRELNRRFGTEDDPMIEYLSVPGRSMNELRSVYYGWLNKLRERPMSVLDNPLPKMTYPEVISKPIRDAFSGAMAATDSKIRNEQIQKGRHYLARMLYPHLGNPADIRTDDLKE